MKMKKQMNSPRDRVDDALLVRLLNESEHFNGNYGNCGNSTRRSNSSCGCRRTQFNINPTVDIRPRRENVNQEGSSDNCGCDREDDCAKKNCLSDYPLAMSYTPDQEWRNLFPIEEALHHGTVFCELELPFYPGCRSCK